MKGKKLDQYLLIMSRYLINALWKSESWYLRIYEFKVWNNNYEKPFPVKHVRCSLIIINI